jgi:hypothetical protein
MQAIKSYLKEKTKDLLDFHQPKTTNQENIRVNERKLNDLGDKN